jgi:hypothetical protein
LQETKVLFLFHAPFSLSTLIFFFFFSLVISNLQQAHACERISVGYQCH